MFTEAPLPSSGVRPDEAATLALGAKAAGLLNAPATVYLEGGLGAGKTTFARGLLHALGYVGAVKSPTYAIVESYVLPQLCVRHFDLYRFATPEEWTDAGLDEMLSGCLCLIEWPEMGGPYTQPADYTITLAPEAGGRRCTIRACNPKQQKELELWQN